MALYFVQHGLSLTKDQDPSRSLSLQGRQEVESVADSLQSLNIPLKNIYHSGKTRASETAGIFADHLGVEKIIQLEGMNPNDDVKAFSSLLDFNECMYVGHLPHLNRLTSLLVSGDENAQVLQFRNAGVIKLDKADHQVLIHWYLTPELVVFR